MRNRIVIAGMVLTLGFATAPQIHAAAILPVEPAGLSYQLRDTFRKSIGMPLHNTLYTFEGTLTNIRGSHVHLRYQSSVPLLFSFSPFTVGRTKFTEHYLLKTTLPASTEGDVLIPILSSPRWNPGSDGVYFIAYSPTPTPPTIVEAIGEDHATVSDYIAGFFEQFWQPELFDIASINWLEGYRVANTPASFIAGFVFLCVAGVLLLRRRTLAASLSIAGISVILLYSMRFGSDLLPIAASDAKEWISQNTYGQGRDIYAIASSVRQLRRPHTVDRIAVCGGTATALSFLLSPTAVDESEEAWRTAPYAALIDTWSEQDGIVTCGTRSRPGRILSVFPKGGALVEFVPAPDA